MDKLLFKVEVFEGPLDILIHLVKKSKVNITDIPISEITSQYLFYIKEMQNINLDISSEFLVMAADLLYVKSRALLPNHDAKEEEFEFKENLKRSVEEYQKYKEISLELKERANSDYNLYYKSKEELTVLKNYDIGVLLRALNKFKNRNTVNIKSNFKMRRIVSINKKIAKILKFFKTHKKVVLERLINASIENVNNKRSEVIAVFLAVLELLKTNKLGFKEENNKIWLLPINANHQNKFK